MNRPGPGGDILVAPPPAGPKSAVRPGPGGDIFGCAPPRPARNVHSELRLDVVSQTVRQSDSQTVSQTVSQAMGAELNPASPGKMVIDS